MRKLLLILSLLVVGLFGVAQTPIPSNQGYPIKQSIGSDSAIVVSKGAFAGRIILFGFADTTAANLHRVKRYPFALIGTTGDGLTWYRSKDADRWINASGGGSGGGDTFTIINGDSTLIICTPAGCDTFNFDFEINNFFFINDSTAVVCDSTETICVGDSCYTQQICDTIPVPRLTQPFFQNLVRTLNNSVIREGGDSQFSTEAFAIHDTYYYMGGYQLTIQGGALLRPVLQVNQKQFVTQSSSIAGFNHYGYYPPDGLIDSANRVNLYINYTNPFAESHTTGFMGTRIGYLIMGNSAGGQGYYTLDNDESKQAGLMVHTLDTDFTDAVTIFGNQVSSTYNFGNNPPVDSTLLDARIAIFKTDKNIQAPGYPNTRNNGTAGIAVFPLDTEGNLGVGAVAGGSTITIINDTTIAICSFGNQLCDTFITVEAFPIQLVTIIDSTHLQVCDTAGNCNIFEIPATGFDRGYFDPNQTSAGETRHQTAGFDFAVGRNYTLSPTGTTDNFLFGNGNVINANATRNFVAIFNNSVSGSENAVFGRNMVVAGNDNFVAATDGQVFSTANYSSTFGDATINRGTAALTANFGNKNWAENGATFGSNNVNGSLNPTVGTANLYSNSFVSGLQNFSLGNVNFVSGSNVTANNATGFITMFGKDYTVTDANSFNVGYTTNAFQITANKVRINEARFEEYAGTSTAAANNLTLPSNGNLIPISGATQINAITTANWQAGSKVWLLFSGAPLVKNNTAGGAGTATLLLQGRVDFQAAAGDILYIGYDGTNWYEINRALAATTPGGSLTTDNLLTLNTATNIRLGGTATLYTLNTYGAFSHTHTFNSIDSSGFIITSTSTAAANNAYKLLDVRASGTNSNGSQLTVAIYGSNVHAGGGTNYGLQGEASGGSANVGVRGDGTQYGMQGVSNSIGVYGLSNGGVTGYGVSGESGATAGAGVNGQGNTTTTPGVRGFGASGGIPIRAETQVSTATPNTIQLMYDALVATNSIGNVPGNGFGGSLSFNIHSNNGGTTQNRFAGLFGVYWADVTDGTRTSNAKIGLVNSAASVDAFIIGGQGYVQLRAITASAASAITAANGMLVYVSDTDATFTSVGIWARENGAWVKL